MSDEATPPCDPPAEVPLTRADIPEFVKAVVAAVEKTTGTPKPPSRYLLHAMYIRSEREQLLLQKALEEYNILIMGANIN